MPGQVRCNNLMLLNIYKEELDALDLRDIARVCSEKKRN